MLHGLVQDLEGGYAAQNRIRGALPGVAWSLPLYELALMTARRAYEMSRDDVEIRLCHTGGAPARRLRPRPE